MPRRTKREKIIAEYRKRLTRLSQNPRFVPGRSAPSPVSTYKLPSVPPHDRATRSLYPAAEELMLVKRDMMKTIGFALVVLVGEFFVFWFWS